VEEGLNVEYVQGRTVDEVLENERRLDLVKIDIEGYEPIALRGMRKTLDKHRPMIISEFHPKVIRECGRQDPQEYLNALVSLVYRLSVIELTGNVIDCAEPADVVDYWREINRQRNTGDTMHLDIIATPREARTSVPSTSPQLF